ncbi:MAG: DNA mismatch repair protein MutS [Polyangiaceae bacterium]|nr:DNA mismatch repair protein MutS [Polyangiaceae bacterium]
MSAPPPGEDETARACAEHGAPRVGEEASRGSWAARYAERAARAGADARRLGVRSRRVANLRGLAFAAFAVSAIATVLGHGSTAVAAGGLVALVTFAGLAAHHARVLEDEDDALRRVRVNRDAEVRVTGRWRDLPEDGARFADPSHPYTSDLDVFGRGSLFQRISTAHTRFGQDALARLFSEASSASMIAARQAAARALAPELELRQRLEALALAVVEPPPSRVDEAAGRAAARDPRGAKRDAPDPEPLLRWAESEPVLSIRRAVVIAAWALPFATLTSAVAAPLLGIPGSWWLIPVVLQVLLNLATRETTGRVFAAVSVTEGAFLRYGAMLRLVEEIELEATLLRELRARLQTGGVRPSQAMQEFRRVVAWFELRHNGVIHPFVNALTCWDIHCVLRLEAWQRRVGRAARDWFSALGDIEALSSLAGHASDEPGATFPAIDQEGPFFVAEGLAHPLIDPLERVANDVTLATPGRALMVTGSNMSGKSTLLRAMGLSAVLAHAGGAVIARRLAMTEVRLGTSIRLSDSLADGVSHFYAEVRRLREIVEAVRGDKPVLFLLDEILHGTNSRERQIGARWVLAELVASGASGAVSTHDMELVKLPPELADRVELVHFREAVTGDRMTFDYRLRIGPVRAGNALRLMRLVGLPVPLE